MLRDLSLKGVYRSDADNLLEDFYLAALRESVAYDRAVGFFSASMLSFAAQGISALIENGGSMRLIFGGELDEQDANAIRDGYDIRSVRRKIGDDIITVIDSLAEALARNRLEALAWLIGAGRLEIKVALKRKGMYHEKLGIFRDSAGDQVVFQGSANESAYALLPDFNFESISVYPTWREEFKEHYLPFIDGFERLWANQTKNTLVLDFPDAARERLIKIAARARPPAVEIERDLWSRLSGEGREELQQVAEPQVPRTLWGSGFVLRDHQRQALSAWRAHDFQGILAMATGSGKTITAIYGLVRVFQSVPASRLFVVVAVPYQGLADQWVQEFSLFGLTAIRCYANRAEWEADLTRAVSLFQSGALRFAACVVVNRTLQAMHFQDRLSHIPGGCLAFVGDECHHYGAEGLSAALPRHASIRLGLSATPEHYFDADISKRVTDYFGPIAFRYSLADALRDGVLTPYRYFPHLVDLISSEAEEYAELSRRIALLAARAGSELENTVDSTLKLLLFRRSRLLGNASGKVGLLRASLRGVQPTPYHLFYCGDGSVEGDAEDVDLRQVDEVSSLLHELGWRVSHFTSRESRADRQALLERFRVGLIDGLVAIRCLDEGIDVPDCRTAYILASSRNPRQFIQRRGRILRRAPGKDVAIVHDFVVRLPEGLVAESKLERDLLINELRRVSEFADLASNRGEVFETLRPILERYDLLHSFT